MSRPESFTVELNDDEVHSVIAGLRAMAEILERGARPALVSRDAWEVSRADKDLERARGYRKLASRILKEVVEASVAEAGS